MLQRAAFVSRMDLQNGEAKTGEILLWVYQNDFFLSRLSVAVASRWSVEPLESCVSRRTRNPRSSKPLAGDVLKAPGVGPDSATTKIESATPRSFGSITLETLFRRRTQESIELNASIIRCFPLLKSKPS
jgi:hypothetical protein